MKTVTIRALLLLLSLLLPSSVLLAQSTVLKGGTLITINAEILRGYDLKIEGRRIKAIGKNLKGDKVIDITGKTVTPGLIDPHSHLGVYPMPASRGTSDGNEATSPTTPGIWSGDGIDVADPAIARAVAYGVTTVQVLPGSANNIGGQSTIIKLHGKTLDDLLFKEAPRGMKHAMGENPKRVYGSRKQLPSTRMGNLLVMRRAYAKAVDYRNALKKWKRKKKGVRPARDLDSEALLGVIDGKIKLHVHCYRTDGMEALFRLADEFGFKVSALHHALEAYKIPELLKKRGVTVVTFSDLGHYKAEATRATTKNAALLVKSGVRLALHTDHPVIEQRYFIHEAAKAVRYGLSRKDAFRAITLNPAISMGIDKMVGSLEVGKHADVVVWEGDPLAIGSFARMVFIDGKLIHSADRRAP